MDKVDLLFSVYVCLLFNQSVQEKKNRTLSGAEGKQKLKGSVHGTRALSLYKTCCPQLRPLFLITMDLSDLLERSLSMLHRAVPRVAHTSFFPAGSSSVTVRIETYGEVSVVNMAARGYFRAALFPFLAQPQSHPSHSDNILVPCTEPSNFYFSSAPLRVLFSFTRTD